MHRLAGIFAAFTILCGSAYTPVLAQDNGLTVFAAASMKNALDDIDAAFTAKTGIKIVTSSITNESVDELGIKANDKVTVVVKASDVMIAVD